MAKVLVETSARHLHLSQQDLETLFGEGFELTFKKALSQPGQFATNEKVEVIGPKKSMGMISVLGPVRKQTQVELSMTDARSIGIAPFVRESGDLAGTPGCRLVGQGRDRTEGRRYRRQAPHPLHPGGWREVRR